MSDRLSRVLNEISQEITGSIRSDIEYKKRRDDQLFGMMFQNELQNQNLYKQQLIEAGLSLDTVDQSDGFNIFAGNAGDSTKLDSMVSSFVGMQNYNKAALDSLTQFEAGKDAGGILRSAGLATTAGESGASTMMFNPDELKAALSYGVETGTISPAQAVDNAFLKGLQLNEEEALKMINLQTETKKNEVLLDNAAIEGNKLKLETLEGLHGDTSAIAGSIVIDRLQGAGIDVTFFQRIAEGDKETVETKSEMLSELQENIIKEHPELAADLISALKIYASPDEQGHNKHHGLVQLGLLAKNVANDMATIENWAYNQVELRNKLGLKIDPQHGGLDEDSIEKLRIHLDGEAQINIGDNAYSGFTYGDLIAKNNSLQELNLIFDESSLLEFENIIRQNDRLDVLRINQFNELFGEQGYDASYTDTHPASSQSYFNSQAEIVDGYLKDLENMQLNIDTNDDDMDPFGLNIPDIDLAGLGDIVDAENKVNTAMDNFSKSYSALATGVPGIGSPIVSSPESLYKTSTGIQSGMESFRHIPHPTDIEAMAENLVNRIQEMNTVGGQYLPRSPFGLLKNTPRDVINNQDIIKQYIKLWNDFKINYESVTGRRIELDEIKKRVLNSTSELDKSLDLLEQNQEVDEDMELPYDEDYPPVVRFMQGGI